MSGKGTDAHLMRNDLETFGHREAYATLHVGWGPNKAARYEALTMYNRRKLNGTELRAVAGNFLHTTGANEFARHLSEGLFDRPMMGCTAVQVYGATETGPVTCDQRAAEAVSTTGSIGRPGTHVQIRIAAPDGSLCLVDEPGEISTKEAISGRHVLCSFNIPTRSMPGLVIVPNHWFG